MKLAVTGCPRNCAEALRQGPRRRRDRAAAAGRSTSAARPARTSARATCSPPSTPPSEVDHADRPVPAVLPGERELARAHLRVRAAGRHRAVRAVRRRRQRGHRRRARRSACRQSVDAYRDPWQERPASRSTPGQFRTVAAAVRCPRCRSDERRMDLDATHRLGRSTRSRSARAAPSPSTATRSPCSGCADGRCGRCDAVCPHARRPARRRPDRRDEIVCPLHGYAFSRPTAHV